MVKKIDIGKTYRAIFISDIHGNFQRFKALLEKVNYKDEDYLFILGDMIEKGSESLQTLRFIMSLYKSNRVFAIVGNCDDYILMENYDVNKYMYGRCQSILWQMIEEIGFIDIPKMKEHFKEEIDFVRNLPLIIESNDFILAHAGVYPNDNYLSTDYEYATTHDYHGLVDYKYKKPLVVGHWGAAFYNDGFILNPHLDYKKNIFSIDGSNQVKEYGQLNALIVNRNNDEFAITFEAVDNLKEVKVMADQVGTKGEKILWPFNKIEIVKEEGLFVYGYLKQYGTRGIIEGIPSKELIKTPKAFVRNIGGEYYTYEYGNYFLDLKESDMVKIIVDNNKDFVIGKFKGEMGLIKREILEL